MVETTPNGNWGMWDKIKYLVSNPNLFFEKVKRETGIATSLVTYVIVATFFTVIRYYAFTFGQNDTLTKTLSSFIGSSGWVNFLLSSLPFLLLGLSIVGTFFYSGVIQLILMAFKSEGTYKDTYNVYAYSMLPSLVLSGIPFAGLLSTVYSYILLVKGISLVHQVSKGKAVLACLLPIIILILLLILPMIIFIASFGGI